MLGRRYILTMRTHLVRGTGTITTRIGALDRLKPALKNITIKHTHTVSDKISLFPLETSPVLLPASV